MIFERTTAIDHKAELLKLDRNVEITSLHFAARIHVPPRYAFRKKTASDKARFFAQSRAAEHLDEFWSWLVEVARDLAPAGGDFLFSGPLQDCSPTLQMRARCKCQCQIGVFQHVSACRAHGDRFQVSPCPQGSWFSFPFGDARLQGFVRICSSI